MVTIIEDIAGATVSGTEETDGSRKGVFREISVLATREVGLIIIRSRSITSIGDFELIINCKLVVARAEDVAGMETGPLVNSSWSPICSIVSVVEGADAISSVAIKSSVDKGWRWMSILSMSNMTGAIISSCVSSWDGPVIGALNAGISAKALRLKKTTYENWLLNSYDYYLRELRCQQYQPQYWLS